MAGLADHDSTGAADRHHQGDAPPYSRVATGSRQESGEPASNPLVMPADRDALDLITLPSLTADGIVLAPITGRGPWRALGALRRAMRDLRRRGMSPQVSYVFAVADDGRIVPSRGDEAVVLVMAFRVPPAG